MQRADLRRLSGSELETALEAAQTLRMRSREPFLQAVAQSLAGCPEIGDGVVNRVVRQVLEEDRLFGDSQETMMECNECNTGRGLLC